jgi:hypothetical protein
VSLVITDVVDEDRLYLSLGTPTTLGKQLGRSIAFTPGLQGSLPIKINNQEYIISRESFKKHLDSIGCSDVDPLDIVSKGYNSFIEQRQKTITVAETLMVDSLSPDWRFRQYKALIDAIFKNNLKDVRFFARQGALLDRKFYVVNKTVFGVDREEVLTAQKTKCQTFLYFTLTPLTLAIKLKLPKIVKALYQFKPDTSSDTITTTAYENDSDGISRTQRVKVTKDDATKSMSFSFI